MAQLLHALTLHVLLHCTGSRGAAAAAGAAAGAAGEAAGAEGAPSYSSLHDISQHRRIGVAAHFPVLGARVLSRSVNVVSLDMSVACPAAGSRPDCTVLSLGSYLHRYYHGGWGWGR